MHLWMAHSIDNYGCEYSSLKILLFHYFEREKTFVLIFGHISTCMNFCHISVAWINWEWQF